MFFRPEAISLMLAYAVWCGAGFYIGLEVL